MKRFAFFSDLLFTFFAATLLALCAFRFMDVGFWLSMCLAALCGGLVMASVGAYLQSKRKNLLLKRSDEQKKEKLLLHLALLSDSAKTEFFRNALSKESPLQRFSLLRLHNETQFYFLHFKLSPVNADDVAKYARLKTSKQKILLCGNIEDSARTLCERLHVQVRTGEEVYVALKNADALPQNYLGDLPSAKKRRPALWFAKRNSKRFLFSAALIFLLSMLTPFFYYYVFMSIALLFLAVFVRIFGKSGV